MDDHHFSYITKLEKNPETKTLKNQNLEKVMLLLGAFKKTIFLLKKLKLKISKLKCNLRLSSFNHQKNLKKE
jgi:hypothetical protein